MINDKFVSFMKVSSTLLTSVLDVKVDKMARLYNASHPLFRKLEKELQDVEYQISESGHSLELLPSYICFAIIILLFLGTLVFLITLKYQVKADTFAAKYGPPPCSPQLHIQSQTLNQELTTAAQPNERAAFLPPKPHSKASRRPQIPNSWAVSGAHRRFSGVSVEAAEIEADSRL